MKMKYKLFIILLCLCSLGTRAQSYSKRCAKCGKPITLCRYKGKHPVATTANGNRTAEMIISLKGSNEENYRNAFDIICGKKGEAKDLTTAFRIFYTLCNKGFKPAGFLLGCCYEYGLGVKVDNQKALNTYKKYADMGDACSKTHLAYYYKYGEGTKKDKDLAQRLYKEAFRELSKYSIYDLDLKMLHCLAECYLQCDSVMNDFKALELHKKAAAKGFSPSINMVGRIYELGRGVDKDYAEAVKWYEKGAELGNASSMANLGRSYEHGEGVKTNYAEAMKWYKKAAELGDATSMNQLGWSYNHGEGVNTNYAEAMKWYKKAAELGNAVSMNNLGYMYKDGKGVKTNYAEAIKWYKKAIDYGYDCSEILNELRRKLEQNAERNAKDIVNRQSQNSRGTSVARSNSKPSGGSEADDYVSRMQRSYNQIRKYEQEASGNPMSQMSAANWIAHEFDDNFYPALLSLIRLADDNSGTKLGDYCELQVKKWYNIGKLIAMNYNLSYAIFQ